MTGILVKQHREIFPVTVFTTHREQDKDEKEAELGPRNTAGAVDDFRPLLPLYRRSLSKRKSENEVQSDVSRSVSQKTTGKMVKLFCAVVGAAGRAFSVRVDEGDSVGDLKDAIKKKKPNKITCDANELQLYLAKRGDVWLTENDVKYVALDNQGNLRGFDMMHPTLWIKNDRYFGEKFQPNEGQIHVLVVVPTDDVAVPRSVPVAVPTRPEVNLASYDDLLTFLEGEMTDLSAVVSSPPILAQERLEFRLVGREQAIDTACRCFKDIVAHARTSALDHN